LVSQEIVGAGDYEASAPEGFSWHAGSATVACAQLLALRCIIAKTVRALERLRQKAETLGRQSGRESASRRDQEWNLMSAVIGSPAELMHRVKAQLDFR